MREAPHPTKQPWIEQYRASFADESNSRVVILTETVADRWHEENLVADYASLRGLFFKMREPGATLDADLYADRRCSILVTSIEARIRATQGLLLEPQWRASTFIELHKVEIMLELHESGAVQRPCLFLVEWPMTGHQCFVEITPAVVEQSTLLKNFQRTPGQLRPNQRRNNSDGYDIPNRLFTSIAAVRANHAAR